MVTLRPPEPGDASILVAGRDHEWERWLGPGDHEPHPTACILVEGEIVGWVDAGTDHDWLGPGEVNVGYNVFAAHRRKGYASAALRLLFDFLRDCTGISRAHLLIHPDNVASLAVARSVGAVEAERIVNQRGEVTDIRYVEEFRR